MILTEKMKEILYVQQSLPQLKILILWQLMERDLFVCQCQRSMWKNLEFLKWLQIIQIIMKQLLQFQLMR